jgi:four helix bundle protein
MSTYVYNFEKLEIWQLSIALSVKVYKLTGHFPSDEKFGLTSQIRRATNSISANIAEGLSRTKKDRARFIQISFGSAIEVLSHLILSEKLGYLDRESLIDLRTEINELTNKINSFHKQIDK